MTDAAAVANYRPDIDGLRAAAVLSVVAYHTVPSALPGEHALLGRDAAGGSGFVANLVFWTEVGYFDRDVAAKPLLHP